MDGKVSNTCAGSSGYIPGGPALSGALSEYTADLRHIKEMIPDSSVVGLTFREFAGNPALAPWASATTTSGLLPLRTRVSSITRPLGTRCEGERFAGVSGRPKNKGQAGERAAWGPADARPSIRGRFEEFWPRFGLSLCPALPGRRVIMDWPTSGLPDRAIAPEEPRFRWSRGNRRWGPPGRVADRSIGSWVGQSTSARGRSSRIGSRRCSRPE